MKATNIVQSWLEVELYENGKILAEALDELNTALNTAYTHSRVREWEENRNGRGERLPREVRIHMARIIARSVLDAAGFNTKKLSQRQINQLVENFC